MKQRKRLKYLFPLAVLALAGQFCAAQISQSVKDEIRTRVDNGVYPSVALGVWKEGREAYYLYGYADIGGKIHAGKATLYEIGSITKTYTGLLLARYAVEGTLSPDSPADTLLPDTIKLRDSKGNAILLKQLATHTSGLPRVPGNLIPKSLDNPYKDYSRQDLLNYLRQYKPANIGKRYSYSNLGAGLLGEALAMSRGTDYEKLLKKDILSPLGLEHTYIRVPEAQAGKVATGYMGTTPVNRWDFKALAGAGALRASITDLLAYGKSYLDPSNPIKEAAGLAMQIHFTDRNNRKYGLGWYFSGDIAIHNGSTGGFRSFIAINPQEKTVVAIVTNSGSNPVDDIALHLADTGKHRLFTTPQALDNTPEELQNYAGSYQNNGFGLRIRFTVKDNALYAGLPGQQEERVHYYGNHRFYYKTSLARLMFEADENGTIVGLTLYQNGQEVPLIKD